MEGALAGARRGAAAAEGALLAAARGVYGGGGAAVGGGARGDAALAHAVDASGAAFLPPGVAEAAARCLELSLRAEELDAELAGLEAAGGLEEALDRARADLGAGRFLAAGDALGALREQLAAADAAGLLAAGEAASLRARSRELEEELAQGLDGALDAAVRTAPGDGAAPQEQRQGRPQFAIRVEPGVRGVLGALAARGSLPEHLGRLSGRLLRAAGPLLAGAGARAEVLGGPGGPRSLRWAPLEGGDGGGAGALGWIAGVEVLLRFTAEDVLGGDAFSLRLLAVRLWPDLAQALVDSHLRDAAGHPGFERAAERLVALEAAARALGFLPGDEETGEPVGPGPLERFAETVVQARVEREQQGCAWECRRIMLEWDAAAAPVRWGEPLPRLACEVVLAGLDSPSPSGRGGRGGGAGAGGFVGEGRAGEALAAFSRRHAAPPAGESVSFFDKGEGAMTPCSVAVGDVLQGALAELQGCEDPFRARCLLGALHHTAVMYRLLPPGSARGATALAGLRGAALYYNDCEFLSEEVSRALALWRGGRGALRAAVRPAVTDLLNALQELRRGGYRYVDRRILEEVEALLDALDGAEAFERCLGPGRRQAVAGAVAAMAERLQALGRETAPLLRPLSYAKVAGSVLQAVLDRVMQELLELSDISAEESEALPQLLAPLLEAAAELAQGPGQDGGDFGAASAQAVRAFAPALPKLKAAVGLLEAPLRDVVHRWATGLLPAVGFSSSEVAGLVEALFEDSPLRRSSLEAITRVALSS